MTAKDMWQQCDSYLNYYFFNNISPKLFNLDLEYLNE